MERWEVMLILDNNVEVGFFVNRPLYCMDSADDETLKRRVKME